MKFEFNEETDYGQDVLELIAIATSLTDAETVYQKTDVNAILIHLKEKAYSIQKKCLSGRHVAYFVGGDE